MNGQQIEFRRFVSWHMKTGANQMTPNEIDLVYPKFEMYNGLNKENTGRCERVDIKKFLSNEATQWRRYN